MLLNLSQLVQICRAGFLASLLLLISINTWAELLVRAHEHDFPSTYIRNGAWQGMDVEIVSRVMESAGLSHRIEDLPFERSLIQMSQGSVHLVLNVTKNNARSEYMEWLGPLRITCIGLVVQLVDKDLAVSSTDDLISIATQRNQKVGYLSGASYSPTFDERLASDQQLNQILYFLPENLQHREMLILGRLMGYFHDAFEIKSRMQDEEFAGRYAGLALNDYRIEDSCTGAYIGISKRLPQATRDKIKVSFEDLVKTGTFSEIHKKWLGREPEFLESLL